MSMGLEVNKMVDKLLHRCANIDDLRKMAKRKIPRPLYDLLSRGVGGETTLEHNVADFDRYQLNQHILRDVSKTDLRTRVLGMDTSFPLILSPTGGQGIFHPDGEVGAARAAAKAGIIYSYPCFGSMSPEEVAEAGPAPRIFQFYACRDRAIEAELIQRAKEAKYGALGVTVDHPVSPRIDALHRWGFFDQSPPLRLLLAMLRKPRWLLSHRKFSERLVPYTVKLHRQKGYDIPADAINWTVRRDFTWDQITDLRRTWDAPLVLKGIVNVEDAKRAASLGVDAIIVCNHGGNGLDGSPSSIAALERISDAVGSKMEVLLGSGIRRGTSMIKAMALGAKASVIGRAFLFGLAAAGEDGVGCAIELLRGEFDMTLRQIGCTSPTQLNRDFIYRDE
jgi:L-lactate dehydrogenase (cytochrome)